jgi:hypothetical protein
MDESQSKTTEAPALAETMARAMACHFSMNRMPHMSGDPLARLSSQERRRLDDATTAALAAIREAGFAVVRASALGGVIDDAEASVRDACCVRDGKPHPALARRYERDMEDINELRKELTHAQQS